MSNSNTFFLSELADSVYIDALLPRFLTSQYGMFKRQKEANDKSYTREPHAMSIIFHFPCSGLRSFEASS